MSDSSSPAGYQQRNVDAFLAELQERNAALQSVAETAAAEVSLTTGLAEDQVALAALGHHRAPSLFHVDSSDVTSLHGT